MKIYKDSKVVIQFDILGQEVTSFTAKVINVTKYDLPGLNLTSIDYIDEHGNHGTCDTSFIVEVLQEEPQQAINELIEGNAR